MTYELGSETVAGTVRKFIRDTFAYWNTVTVTSLFKGTVQIPSLITPTYVHNIDPILYSSLHAVFIIIHILFKHKVMFKFYYSFSEKLYRI